MSSSGPGAVDPTAAASTMSSSSPSAAQTQGHVSSTKHKKKATHPRSSRSTPKRQRSKRTGRSSIEHATFEEERQHYGDEDDDSELAHAASSSSSAFPRRGKRKSASASAAVTKTESDDSDSYAPSDESESAHEEKNSGDGSTAYTGGSKSIKAPTFKRKVAHRPKVSVKHKHMKEPKQADESATESRADLSKLLDLSAPLLSHSLEISTEGILAMGGSEYVHIVPMSIILETERPEKQSHQEAIKFNDLGSCFDLTSSQLTASEINHASWTRDDSAGKHTIGPRRCTLALQWSPPDIYEPDRRSTYGNTNCSSALAVLLSDHSLSVFVGPHSPVDVYWKNKYNLSQKLTQLCQDVEDKYVNTSSSLQKSETELKNWISKHLPLKDGGDEKIFESYTLLPIDATVSCISWSPLLRSPSTTKSQGISLLAVGTRNGVWVFLSKHCTSFDMEDCGNDREFLRLVKYFIPFHRDDIDSLDDSKGTVENLGYLEYCSQTWEFPCALCWRLIEHSDDIISIDLVTGGSLGSVNIFRFHCSYDDGDWKIMMDWEAEKEVRLQGKRQISKVYVFASQNEIHSDFLAVVSDSSLTFCYLNSSACTLSNRAIRAQENLRNSGWFVCTSNDPGTGISHTEIFNAHSSTIRAITSVFVPSLQTYNCITVDSNGELQLWNTGMVLRLLDQDSENDDGDDSSMDINIMKKIHRTEKYPFGAIVSPSQCLIVVYRAKHRHSTKGYRRWNFSGAFDSWVFPWITDSYSTLLDSLSCCAASPNQKLSLIPLQCFSDVFYVISSQLRYSMRDIAHTERQLNFSYDNESSVSKEESDKLWNLDQMCRPYLYELILQQWVDKAGELLTLSKDNMSTQALARNATEIWMNFFRCTLLLENVIVPLWMQRYQQMYEHVRASNIPTYDLRVMDQAENHIRAETLRLQQFTMLTRTLWLYMVLANNKDFSISHNKSILDDATLSRNEVLLSTLSKALNVFPLLIPMGDDQVSDCKALSHVWEKFQGIVITFYPIHQLVGNLISDNRRAASAEEESSWCSTSIRFNFATLESAVQRADTFETSAQKFTFIKRIIQYFGDKNLKEFIDPDSKQRLNDKQEFWTSDDDNLGTLLNSCDVVERCAISNRLLEVDATEDRDCHPFVESALPTGRSGVCLAKHLDAIKAIFASSW